MNKNERNCEFLAKSQPLFYVCVCGGLWGYMHPAKSNDEQSRILYTQPHKKYSFTFIFKIAQQVIKYELKNRYSKWHSTENQSTKSPVIKIPSSY